MSRSLDTLLETLEAWNRIDHTPWDLDPSVEDAWPAAQGKLSARAEFDERADLEAVLGLVHRLILEEGTEQEYAVFSESGPKGDARVTEEARDVARRLQSTQGISLQLPALQDSHRNLGLADGCLTLTTTRPETDTDWVDRWIGQLEGALGRKLAARFVRTRGILGYDQVVPFLVFKALAWLSGLASGATHLGLASSDLEQHADLPLRGKPEPCSDTGLELPARLAVDVLQTSSLGGLLTLSMRGSDGGEYEARLREKKVQVTSSSAEAAARAIQAWAALEQQPVGDPSERWYPGRAPGVAPS